MRTAYYITSGPGTSFGPGTLQRDMLLLEPIAPHLHLILRIRPRPRHTLSEQHVALQRALLTLESCPGLRFVYNGRLECYSEFFFSAGDFPGDDCSIDCRVVGDVMVADIKYTVLDCVHLPSWVLTVLLH